MEKSRNKEQECIDEMMKMKKRNEATTGKSEKEGTKMKLQKCRIEETKMTKNNEAATETCI
jgi:hypothetical protein